jgi:phosphatidylinositol dimannoside acyltransferase
VTDADSGTRLAARAPDRRADRGTAVQRARAAVLSRVSILACRLPERPQVALAELAGRLWYRLAPRRAGQARRNLKRVVDFLVASGLADERTRRAAADPRALEQLVRSSFRHNARYYLEVIRAPALDARIFDERVVVETPDVVETAFADERPKVFISAHLGPIELPGIYLARRSGRRITAPMETVDDPALQGWFERTRSTFGVRIITLREARRELLAELRRGESVGLVADRDISGGGIEVPLFGAPAPLPIGPAFLAIETGSPLYLAGIWRTGRLGYRGRLVEVPVLREGGRRERIAATLAEEARAFERIIANAPDQWAAIFFPIWPDLAGDASAVGANDAGGGAR